MKVRIAERIAAARERADAAPPSCAVAMQRHYSPEEVAEMWQVNAKTVRRLFEDRPGVLKLGRVVGRTTRRYTILRIPHSVLEQGHKEFAK